MKQIAEITTSHDNTLIHPEKLKRLIGLVNSWLNNTREKKAKGITYGMNSTTLEHLLYSLTAYCVDYDIMFVDIISNPRSLMREKIRRMFSGLKLSTTMGIPGIAEIKIDYDFSEMTKK